MFFINLKNYPQNNNTNTQKSGVVNKKFATFLEDKG